MKQYFKDYKAKMLKDEELISSIVNLQIQDENNTGKGVFVKRKITKESDEKKSDFLFNFTTPSIDDELENVVSNIETIKM
jgi:hypothetical protein